MNPFEWLREWLAQSHTANKRQEKIMTALERVQDEIKKENDRLLAYANIIVTLRSQIDAQQKVIDELKLEDPALNAASDSIEATLTQAEALANPPAPPAP